MRSNVDYVVTAVAQDLTENGRVKGFRVIPWQIEGLPTQFTGVSAQLAGLAPDRLVKKEPQEQKVGANELMSSAQAKADAQLKLTFTHATLDDYIAYRSEGIAKKSKDWINRASQAMWDSTQGEISHQTMTSFRTYVLSKYSSVDAHRKVLGFAAAFLKYLAQVRVDPRYLSFTLFLERPKTTRTKKAITERIVTREDITSLFKRIDVYAEKGKISPQKTRNYRAYTLLASYTGLRPSTIQRLTVGQFRTALNEEKDLGKNQPHPSQWRLFALQLCLTYMNQAHE